MEKRFRIFHRTIFNFCDLPTSVSFFFPLGRLILAINLKTDIRILTLNIYIEHLHLKTLTFLEGRRKKPERRMVMMDILCLFQNTHSITKPEYR